MSLMTSRYLLLGLLPLLSAAALAWALPMSEESRAVSAVPRPKPATVDIPVRRFDAKYEASVGRPLFVPTRRPLPPPPPQASLPERVEPPTKPLNATLVGVAISPDKRMAVLKLATGKNVTVSEGEALEGWELIRVNPELAEFRSKTAVAELTFPIRSKATAQPVTTAAPAPTLRRRQ